jgi:transposase
MEEITTIGLDIAKSVFQLHAISATGTVVVRRQLKRRHVVQFFASLEPCLVGIEACATAHHWGRALAQLGHEVRLMPPRYLKPYVKRSKNDAADAEAICEAVTRPNMRFVPIKTIDQQSILTLHRTRMMFVRQRTMAINAVRAHLAEFGIVAAIGRNGLLELLDLIRKGEKPEILAEAPLCLAALADQVDLLKQRILQMDRQILKWHRTNDLSRKLEGIPGVGPLVATALAASIPDPGVFRSGRDLSAWIGLVPKKNSSGGKEKLGGISKAGNRYLRQLLVIGALACMSWTKIRPPLP